MTCILNDAIPVGLPLWGVFLIAPIPAGCIHYLQKLQSLTIRMYLDILLQDKANKMIDYLTIEELCDTFV